MKISEVMTRCPYNIEASATLHEVEKVMNLHQIRHLPVMDDDGELVGVLSDRDVKVSQIISATTNFKPTAGDVCFKEPYVVEADTDAQQVAKDMAEKKIDYALVEGSDGIFEGIFTTTDACRTLALILGETAKRKKS